MKIFILLFMISPLCFSMDTQDDPIKINVGLLNSNRSKIKEHEKKLKLLNAELKTQGITTTHSQQLFVTGQEYNFATNKKTLNLKFALYLYLLAFKKGHQASRHKIKELVEDACDIDQRTFKEQLDHYTGKREKPMTDDESIELKALIPLIFDEVWQKN